MNLVFAAAIGIVFGAGIFLILKTDVFRVVVGLILVSNAANLTLIGSGTRGQAPILPATGDEPVADPLVQAMTLTALVIGFAVTALLLGLAFSVFATRGTIDLGELSRQQSREAMEAEAEEPAHDEEREREPIGEETLERDEALV